MAKVVFQQHIPDAGDYFQLFNTTGWNKSYQASQTELQKAIEQSWFIVCAYQDNQLVGVGRVVSDGVLYAMIYDLIVHPDFQKQGIGSRLLNHCLQACEQANIRSIQLFSAKGKVEYYQKRGFVKRPNDAPGMVYSPD